MLAGVIEDGDVVGGEPAPPQPLPESGPVRRDRLFQRAPVSDAGGERAGGSTAFPLSRHQFKG